MATATKRKQKAAPPENAAAVVDDYDNLSGKLQELWRRYTRQELPLAMHERSFIQDVLSGVCPLTNSSDLNKAEHLIEQHYRPLPPGATSTTTPAGIAAHDPDASPDADVFAKTSPVGMTVQAIPLEKIHRWPKNRGGVPVTFPEVADLVASIETCGLSTPITVRTTSTDQDLPIGHYELVKGERRYTAARVMRWETIPAFVVDLPAAAAAVQANVDNTQAVVLNPIQRAIAIRDAIAAGVPEDVAAASVGLPKGAKNALRLLELPEAIQEAVASGTLPQKIALALVPYRDLAAVMKEVSRDIKSKAWWLNRASDTDTKFHIERLVQEHTRRPASCQPKRREWETAKPAIPDKLLTLELRQELGAVEVRLNNKPTVLFTNTKRYDELAAEVHKEEKAAADAKKRKAEAKARAAGKPANPDAEKHQDEILREKAEDWRHRFLRLGIAQALVADDARTAYVCEWLRLTLDDAGYESHRKTLAITEYVAEQLGKPVRRKSTGYYSTKVKCWDLVQELLPWDGDPLTDREALDCQRAKYLLWPQVTEGKPRGSFDKVIVAAGEPVTDDFLVQLDRDDVESVAKWLSETKGLSGKEAWRTAFAHGWARATEAGPERVMFEELLGFCNKRQLLALAGEMLIQLPDGKLDAMRQTVLAAHVGRGLLVPAMVSGKKVKPAKASRKKASGKGVKGTPPADDIETTTAGVCRVCGCTEDEPCENDYGGCSWTDESRTLCTACAGEDD